MVEEEKQREDGIKRNVKQRKEEDVEKNNLLVNQFINYLKNAGIL